MRASNLDCNTWEKIVSNVDASIGENVAVSPVYAATPAAAPKGHEAAGYFVVTAASGQYKFQGNTHSSTIDQNPPFIGFSLLDNKKVQGLDCFIFDSKGQVEREIFKFNERVEIRLNRELSTGRSRMNCTVKDSAGVWRWFGHQFYF